MCGWRQFQVSSKKCARKVKDNCDVRCTVRAQSSIALLNLLLFSCFFFFFLLLHFFQLCNIRNRFFGKNTTTKLGLLFVVIINKNGFTQVHASGRNIYHKQRNIFRHDYKLVSRGIFVFHQQIYVPTQVQGLCSTFFNYCTHIESMKVVDKCDGKGTAPESLQSRMEKNRCDISGIFHVTRRALRIQNYESVTGI